MRVYEGSGLKPVIETTSNAFNGEEEAVIGYIREHGSITRKETDALLNVSQTTSSRILRRMAENGLIRHEGAGRRTRYILK